MAIKTLDQLPAAATLTGDELSLVMQGGLARKLALNSLVLANDPRLTDARTPTAHNHSIASLGLATVAVSGSYTDLINKPTSITSYNDLTDKPTAVTTISLGLAAVATSGSYADLINKPTAVSAFTNDSGYQTADDVSTSSAPIAHVGTGDTAHAAATTTVAGFMSAADKTKLDTLSGSYSLPVATDTILGGVKDGTGVTIAADGTVSIDYGTTADTAVQGNDARVTADGAANTATIRTLGTGATQAAAGNHTHAYQDTLVSGTSIKTVNSVTLLGSGNITTGDVTLTGTQTLTNKTLANVVFSGDYTEGSIAATTGTAYTIALANGTLQILTLTGNCTYTFPAAAIGKSFTLLQKQDATGNRTVTWPAISSLKWPGNVAPTITATASSVDKYVFVSDGTYWYGSTAGSNY